MFPDTLPQRYEELFPDDTTKAAAFDELAARYYAQNFGTTQKAELDLFMFSLYLDRVYRTGTDNRNHSDYTLSKELGITQGRVRSLKERKEIKYPSAFDWKEAFLNELYTADARDNKIRVYIHDMRLYTELENLVQKLGSYSETTLTRQLLVLTPPVFMDLVMLASQTDADEKALRKQLAQILSNNQVDPAAFLAEEASLASVLKPVAADVAISILLAGLDVVGVPLLSVGAAGLIELIRQGLEHSKKRTS